MYTVFAYALANRESCTSLAAAVASNAVHAEAYLDLGAPHTVQPHAIVSAHFHSLLAALLRSGVILGSDAGVLYELSIDENKKERVKQLFTLREEQPAVTGLLQASAAAVHLPACDCLGLLGARAPEHTFVRLSRKP